MDVKPGPGKKDDSTAGNLEIKGESLGQQATGQPENESTRKEEGGNEDKWQTATKPRRLAPQYVVSKQDLGADSPRNRAMQQTQEGRKKGKLSLQSILMQRKNILSQLDV